MLISASPEPSGGGHLAVAAIAPERLRIFQNGRIVENRFASIGDEPAQGSGPVIVSLKRFLREKVNLLSRGAPLGVRLETSESAEALKEDIAQLELVEVHVPYFKDGRAFSLVRQLRTRFRFIGEIRVSGHVLIDQIAFFIRVGADSFVLRDNVTAAEIEQAIGMISDIYQPSVDGRATIQDLRRRPQSRP